MKKLFFAVVPLGIVLFFAVFLSGMSSQAAPAVGLPSAIPTAIKLATPTYVTVSIPIPDQSLVSNSVNLLRLNGSTSSPVILGTMHDDGLNGDAVAGDGIYTLRVQFIDPKVEQIQLQVSEAFKGLIKRVVTSPITIAVTADGTKALPPDPGTAGMSTLAGIDSDGDGVRDDIERYIALNYSTSTKIQAALTQIALALQSQVTSPTSQAMAVANIHSWSYATECLDSFIATSDADIAGLDRSTNIESALKAVVLNTPERAQAFFNSDAQIGPMTFKRPDFKGLESRCSFDPSIFPN